MARTSSRTRATGRSVEPSTIGENIALSLDENMLSLTVDIDDVIGTTEKGNPKIANSRWEEVIIGGKTYTVMLMILEKSPAKKKSPKKADDEKPASRRGRAVEAEEKPVRGRHTKPQPEEVEDEEVEEEEIEVVLDVGSKVTVPPAEGSTRRRTGVITEVTQRFFRVKLRDGTIERFSHAKVEPRL